MTPTWQSHVPNAPNPEDRVILVGSFAAVPPITQEREGPAPRCYGYGAEGIGNCPGTVLVGERQADARKTLETAGFSDVLALPWRMQLFAP